MRNNFTNYSQIKFYKNVLKLLKKHASIKSKHISLKFQGILPSYILNSFQKSMLLILIKLEKQGELRKAKSIAISLAQEGEPVERIARILGETEKTIKEWLAETH